MARTLNETIRICTDDYLEQLDMDNLPASVDIEAELVTIVKDACKWRIPSVSFAEQNGRDA